MSAQSIDSIMVDGDNPQAFDSTPAMLSSTAAASTISSRQVAPRKKKAPTLRESDWEPVKDRFIELYTTGTSLQETKELIETEFVGFHAEYESGFHYKVNNGFADHLPRTRQYKYRIEQWNMDKNIKPAEMKYIVKRKQKRKLLEVDKAELDFRVKGNDVDKVKIDRWMRNNGLSDSLLYSPASAVCMSSPSHHLSFRKLANNTKILHQL
jgi:hypothetical protein